MVNPINAAICNLPIESDEDKLIISRETKIKSLIHQIECLRKDYNGKYDRDLEIQAIDIMCDILKLIHETKSATYKDSWKKRGWIVSIFGNIARKFDRLEKIFLDTNLFLRFVEKPDIKDMEESVTDTIADGGVYHLLALTELLITKPALFDDWLNRSLKTKQP